LLAIWFTDAYSDSDCDSNTNSYAHDDGHANYNSDSNVHVNCNANRDWYTEWNSGYSHAPRPPDRCTASLTRT
jgi:hypothetical protein